MGNERQACAEPRTNGHRLAQKPCPSNFGPSAKLCASHFECNFSSFSTQTNLVFFSSHALPAFPE